MTTELDRVKKRQKLTIVAEEFHADYLNGNLAEVVKCLKERLKKVPAEYRDSARFEFFSQETYYDNDEAVCKLEYQREETDEEVAARVQKYKDEVAKQLRYNQQMVEKLQKEIHENDHD